jgi:RimJ/RimL family protein N-acetyltransferase
MVDIQESTDLQDVGPVRIRPALVEDAQRIVDYLGTILQDPMASIADLDEMMLDVHRQREHIRRVNAHPNAYALIAEHEDDVIGFLSVEPGRRRKINHVVELGMSVSEDWRGKGVGKALLENVVQWVKSRESIRKITLNVFSENVAALNLYSGAGFVEEGRLKDHVHLDGGYQDLVLMARYLKQGRQAGY